MYLALLCLKKAVSKCRTFYSKHRSLVIYRETLDKTNFEPCALVLYSTTTSQCVLHYVMFQPFGVCIAVEMVLFVFANDSSENSEITAILQRLETLEEDVSMLNQTLNSCPSECNEFSKSNTETSEYRLLTLSEISIVARLLTVCQPNINEFKVDRFQGGRIRFFDRKSSIFFKTIRSYCLSKLSGWSKLIQFVVH